MNIKELNIVSFDPTVCVRCGYCKSSCPTYLATRDERFSPRGRLILSNIILKSEIPQVNNKLIYDIDTCSKCAQCEKTCPIGLKPYLNFMTIKNKKTILGKAESLIAYIMVNQGEIFKIIFKTMMKIKGIKMKRKGKEKKEEGNDKTEESKKIEGRNGKEDGEGKLAFFPTCFGYKLIPDIKNEAKKLMKFLGVKFYEVEGFLCCGAPLFLSGDMKNFRKNAEKFRRKLKENTEEIVVMGDTCTWIIRNIAEQNVIEFTRFILNSIEEKKYELKKLNESGKIQGRKIFLHVPCHSDGVEHIRLFLEELGFEVELSEFPCCGFGGSMFFKYPKFSDLLLDKMLEGKNFDIAVTTSPGCMLQIMKRCNVIHPIEIISSSLI